MIYLLDLPGPIHDMSLVNKAVVDKYVGPKDTVINTSPSFASRLFRTKIWLPLKLLFQIFVVFRLIAVFSLTSNIQLYRTINGGVGQIYDLVYVVLARLFSADIYIHHHSFQYLNCSSKLFRFLLSIGGSKISHIVLGHEMKQALISVYGVDGARVCIATNMCFIGADGNDFGGDVEQVDRLFTIGHLANLCVEKGLKHFLDICVELDRAGLDFQAKLAGPFADAASKSLYQDYSEKLDNLIYVGPVYTVEKQKFYQSLDAFIFLSEYENEAEPLVLYEAASAGCFVLGSERGCMKSMCSLLSGVSISSSDRFLPVSISTLSELCRDSDVVTRKRERVTIYNDLQNSVVLDQRLQFEFLLGFES